MCCSRDHYPPDVGVWRSDACAGHYHDGDTIYIRQYLVDDDRYVYAARKRVDKSECERDYDHRHLVLPRMVDDNAVVCIDPYEESISLTWSKFRDPQPNITASTNVHINLPSRTARKHYRTHSLALTELFTLAAAEGGTMSTDLIARISAEYAEREGIVVYVDNTGRAFSLAPQPDRIPEYHEWLVMQAQLELQRRNGGVLVA